MKCTSRKSDNFRDGFTLVELILSISLLSVVGLATIGLIRNSSEDFLFASRRSQLLQEGHASLSKMVRVLRQATSLIEVSGPSDTKGIIEFYDNSDISRQFMLHGGTGQLKYGETGNLYTLANSVTSFTVTCYDKDGTTLSDPIEVDEVRLLKFDATFTDSSDSTISFDLSTQVFLTLEKIDVVINEIMYHSTETKDNSYNWVELYNNDSVDVNLATWAFWTGTDSSSDSIIAHPMYGNGSTTIPVGGYALIVPDESAIFNESVINGDFESSNLKDWDTTTNWSSISIDAHSGSQKLESTTNSTSVLMQEVTLTSGMSYNRLSFWEMTNASVEDTLLTVTIRNTSDVVLNTVYSDTFNSTWTKHSSDVSTYAGQTIRIHFETTKAGLSGSLSLDDISLSCSDVPTNIPVLETDDNKLGNGLSDNGDSVVIAEGSSVIDSVTYDNSWGANGDGYTLQLIDPNNSSNLATNWTTGDLAGTPGTEN